MNSETQQISTMNSETHQIRWTKAGHVDGNPSLGAVLHFIFRLPGELVLSQGWSAEALKIRVMHQVAQVVETYWGAQLLDRCPRESSRRNPLALRTGGGKSASTVRSLIVSRFMGRAGGFLTTRYEVDLIECGLLKTTSLRPRILAGEMVARYLGRAVMELNERMRKSTFLHLNLISDCSRVAKHEAKRGRGDGKKVRVEVKWETVATRLVGQME